MFSSQYTTVAQLSPFPHMSLLLVEERLLEAKHFARRLSEDNDRDKFGYELNASLGRARSVRFLLQKEVAKVPAFAHWWNSQGQHLSIDLAATFFSKLRNFSQKEVRMSLVGGSLGQDRWRFGRRRERPVTPTLGQLEDYDGGKDRSPWP